MGKPRLTGTLPHESVIYREVQHGARASELSRMFNVPVKVMQGFIDCRRNRWAESPPRLLESDDRKVVIEVEDYRDHAYRRVRISLPRNSLYAPANEVRP